MTRLDTLRDLKARVEAATGPDREIDGEVMFDLFAKPVGDNGYLWPEDDPSWLFAMRFPGKDRSWFERNRRRDCRDTIVIWRDGDPILMNELRVPKLTASLDAALALVERVLPETGYDLDYVPGNEPAYTATFFGVAARREDGHSLPLAVLSALFAALIAREELAVTEVVG